jgi:aminopeptidase N
LNVRQEQKSDPDSQYPQVTWFQSPVDIEIGTATNTRIERVQIEPKEEQTFKFAVDSEPLLVGFDYGGALIKEVVFNKTTAQLFYQLNNDKDVLGRVWSISQLTARLKDEKIAAAERQSITSSLANTLVNDKFWGIRLEAAAALNGINEAKTALLAATKDANSRVRARAVRSLATLKDPALAATYVALLNDQSYGVVRAAALALGQTKGPMAYDPLAKLIGEPSWRDTIVASALDGLAALGDKRALEFGLKYFAPGNQTAVRINALGLLAAVGKGDPRTYPLISAALIESVERGNAGALAGAEAEALSAIGDARTLTLFQELAKKPGISRQMAAILARFEAALRERLGQAKPGI